MTTHKWARRSSNSVSNFDLVLTNPEELDSKRMEELLTAILQETHRKLSLNSRACTEFRRWFNQPDTPLRSEAYVLLSNWFMTGSGDRHSLVASRCEDLWDELFACRPLNRLSSPEAGRNHVIIPLEFETFWRRLQEVQGANVRDGDELSQEHDTQPSAQKSPTSAFRDTFTDQLRARFDKAGVHCEMEGSPRAIADFFKMMSGWDGGES